MRHRLRLVLGLRHGLLETGDDALQLLQATILLLDFTAQPLQLAVQIDTVLICLGKLGVSVGGVLPLDAGSGRQGRGAHALEVIATLPRHVDDKGAVVWVHVAATEVLTQVLLTRKSIASAAVAVGVRAHQRLLGIGVLLVHLALVAQEAARVREALDLIAAGLEAFVGAIVFVHVFTVMNG